MGHRVALSVLAAAMVSVVLGCGGSHGTKLSGGHTYVLVPTGNQSFLPRTGLYTTILSPLAIPTYLLENSTTKVVAHAKGPQVCSYTRPIQGLEGKVAYLNGKTVTLKVSGSSKRTGLVCLALKEGRAFHPLSFYIPTV